MNKSASRSLMSVLVVLGFFLVAPIVAGEKSPSREWVSVDPESSLLKFTSKDDYTLVQVDTEQNLANLSAGTYQLILPLGSYTPEKTCDGNVQVIIHALRMHLGHILTLSAHISTDTSDENSANKSCILNTSNPCDLSGPSNSFLELTWQAKEEGDFESNFMIFKQSIACVHDFDPTLFESDASLFDCLKLRTKSEGLFRSLSTFQAVETDKGIALQEARVIIPKPIVFRQTLLCNRHAKKRFHAELRKASGPCYLSLTVFHIASSRTYSAMSIYLRLLMGKHNTEKYLVLDENPRTVTLRVDPHASKLDLEVTFSAQSMNNLEDFSLFDKSRFDSMKYTPLFIMRSATLYYSTLNGNPSTPSRLPAPSETPPPPKPLSKPKGSPVASSSLPPLLLVQHQAPSASTEHHHALIRAFSRTETQCDDVSHGISIRAQNLMSSSALYPSRCLLLALEAASDTNEPEVRWSLPEGKDEMLGYTVLSLLYSETALSRTISERAVRHSVVTLVDDEKTLQICFAYDDLSVWPTEAEATRIPLQRSASELLTRIRSPSASETDDTVVPIVRVHPSANGLQVRMERHRTREERDVAIRLGFLALFFPKSLVSALLTVIIGSCGCQTFVVRELSMQLDWIVSPLHTLAPPINALWYENRALFWNLLLLLFFLIPVVLSAFSRCDNFLGSKVWSLVSVWYANHLLFFAFTATFYMAVRCILVWAQAFHFYHSYPYQTIQLILPLIVLAFLFVACVLWLVVKCRRPSTSAANTFNSLANATHATCGILDAILWIPVSRTKTWQRCVLPSGQWVPVEHLRRFRNVTRYDARDQSPYAKGIFLVLIQVCMLPLAVQSSAYWGCYIQSCVFAGIAVVCALWFTISVPYRWLCANLSNALVLLFNGILALLVFTNDRRCSGDETYRGKTDTHLAHYFLFVLAYDVFDGILSFVLLLGDIFLIYRYQTNVESTDLASTFEAKMQRDARFSCDSQMDLNGKNTLDSLWQGLTVE